MTHDKALQAITKATGVELVSDIDQNGNGWGSIHTPCFSFMIESYRNHCEPCDVLDIIRDIRNQH